MAESLLSLLWTDVTISGGPSQRLQDSHTNGGLWIVITFPRKALTKCIKSLSTLIFYHLAILYLEICPKEIPREVYKDLYMRKYSKLLVISEEFKDYPMGLFRKQPEGADP